MAFITFLKSDFNLVSNGELHTVRTVACIIPYR